jgi:hypothetical protein
LNKPDLAREMGGAAAEPEIDGLPARRDQMAELFESRDEPALHAAQAGR